MDGLHNENVRVRDENQRLRAENDYLKRQLLQNAHLRDIILVQDIPRYRGISFSRIELQIVNILMEARKPVSPDEFLTILRPDADIFPKSIDVHICRIRKKLPPDVKITTVWGYGRQMDEASKAAMAARRVT